MRFPGQRCPWQFPCHSTTTFSDIVLITHWNFVFSCGIFQIIICSQNEKIAEENVWKLNFLTRAHVMLKFSVKKVFPSPGDLAMCHSMAKIWIHSCAKKQKTRAEMIFKFRITHESRKAASVKMEFTHSFHPSNDAAKRRKRKKYKVKLNMARRKRD